jgi:hypothetical protein
VYAYTDLTLPHNTSILPLGACEGQDDNNQQIRKFLMDSRFLELAPNLIEIDFDLAILNCGSLDFTQTTDI